MFDWFWDFLYSISEILFELIDALLIIANKLCGIDPITVGDKKTNFMIELFEDPRIFMGFAGAALVAIFLLMFFSIIAICRNCKDGKKTSGEIALEVIKTLGMFFLVPSLMIGFTVLLNEVVFLIYRATSSGAPSLGDFLFLNFCPEGVQDFEATHDYTSVSSVRTFLSSAGYDLSDFRFFFSWLVSIPILFCVARALLLFVERCISIILLFVLSPISISTSVLDDGARFKLWRDKVLTKYLSGYGMIIGLNIYIIVLSFVTRKDVVLLDDVPIISDVLGNFLIRVCIAIGGAFFLPKIFGMVGSLFVQGAGEGEFQSAGSATDGMVKTMGAVKKALLDEDKEKKEKKEKANAKKDRMQNMSKGGGGGGGGGGGLGSALGGSGNANNKGLLGKIVDTGVKVAKAIVGVGKDKLNPENEEYSGGGNYDDDSKEKFNDPNQKKNPLEKIAKAAGDVIKTAGKVTVAIGTGKTDSNSNKEGGN